MAQRPAANAARCSGRGAAGPPLRRFRAGRRHRAQPHERPGTVKDSDGGGGVDRRHSRSAAGRRQQSAFESAAAPPGLSPKDTRLSKHSRASNHSIESMSAHRGLELLALDPTWWH